MSKKPRVETRSATIVLPLKPVMPGNEDCSLPLSNLPVSRFESGWTNLAACDGNREALSTAFRIRHENGDRSAIMQLLDAHPEFAGEPWVQREVAKDPSLIRKMDSRGGRPNGRSQSVVGLGLAIVALAESMHSEQGLPYGDIFELIGKGHNGIGPERVKHLYYETKNDRRLRPFLFTK